MDEISVQSTTSQEVLTAQCLSLIFFDSVSAREFVYFRRDFLFFFGTGGSCFHSIQNNKQLECKCSLENTLNPKCETRSTGGSTLGAKAALPSWPAHARCFLFAWRTDAFGKPAFEKGFAQLSTGQSRRDTSTDKILERKDTL